MDKEIGTKQRKPLAMTEGDLARKERDLGERSRDTCTDRKTRSQVGEIKNTFQNLRTVEMSEDVD